MPAEPDPLKLATALQRSKRWLIGAAAFVRFGGDGDVPVQPEAERLRANRTLCMYGRDETDSLCPLLPHASVEALAMPGGHHFDGAYEQIVSVIVERATAH